MKYLLDTSAINRILDGEYEIGELPENSEFFITHVQIDEINNTADTNRRARLSLMQSQIRPELIPTETLVLDYSRLDNAKLGDGEKYKRILASLEKLSNRKPNNIRDALIAETALANDYCLITADSDLATVAEQHGCEVRKIDS